MVARRSTPVTTESPIGRLIVDATNKAERKTSGVHTATAPCGCEIVVTILSPGSHGIHFDRCSEHPVHR